MGVLAVIAQVEGVDGAGYSQLGGEGGCEGGEVALVPEETVQQNHGRVRRREW